MFRYLAQIGTSTSTSGLPVVDLSVSDSGYSVLELINKGIALVILLAGFLSIVFMLWGGIRFIVSGGKEDKVKSAVHTIRYAVIGLIVTILSITVINLIGRVFNLQLVNYLSYDGIISTINSLFATTTPTR
ncbi:MAG: hypothetical protein A2V81_04780 [Candidatus Abawacabacteria bacterium RBG_16_42_10]|uniref:Uncharacterized protein n=1 Tax=Candidatus Abawacabacteria bacterium RBG_16_42_10 TaxID=1817814 RepID=A0A1F4XIJ9_9BACT|nr:MAG: hypothetical protein A2V81_04780 [Candidatus Abawacabacteria bacterium RBG_16_42_10]